MIPKTEGRDIQLLIVQPFNKTINTSVKTRDGKFVKDEYGKNIKLEEEKLVKENYLKVWYNKERDIGPYGEYAGAKGQIVKTRSLVFIIPTQSYHKVAHSIRELKQAMDSKLMTDIGFKSK